MKKLFYTWSGLCLILAASLLSLSSCTNEDYDLEKVNTEVTIAANGLTLPLGSTKQMLVGDLLSGMDTDILQVIDGGYYAARVEDGLDLGDIVPDFSGMLSVKDIEASSSKVLPVRAKGQLSLGSIKVEVTDEMEFTMIESDFPSAEVKSIESVNLRDAFIEIGVMFNAMPDFGYGSSVEVDMDITFPKEMILDQSDPRVDDHVLNVTGNLRNGAVEVKPVKILALDLSSYDFSLGEDLMGVITIDGALNVKNPSVDLLDIENDPEMNFSVLIEGLDVENVIAHVYYEITGENQHIGMEAFPDFMKDDSFVFDVVHPHIMLTATTNLGFPADGELIITPVVGEEAHTEDMIDVFLALPMSHSSDQVKTISYWLGDTPDLCPDECVYVKADVSRLIRKIPDEFLFSLSSTIDQIENCRIEPHAEYVFDVEYDFVIPFEFGDELHIEMSDTLAGLPDIMKQIMGRNAVQLTGSVMNSLPVQLDLNVDMLDRKGNVIPMKEDISQKIEACKADGNPSSSPLALTLNAQDKSRASEIDALRLSFVISSPGYEGLFIMEDDYVQAELQLTVPEGFTIDLSELDSDEK